MVRGISIFRDFFQDYKAQYLLIGGSACEAHFLEVAQEFRPTYDLDLVLCAEALDASFVQRFWDFVRIGQYQVRERGNGKREFFRFHKPGDARYPRMIELFSRELDSLPVPSGVHLTPVPVEDTVSSLSAILLDRGYYDYMWSQRTEVAGLSVISPAALIVLKARAWLDLRERRAQGIHVDSKNILKHQYDILQLLTLVSYEALALPEQLKPDAIRFLSEYEPALDAMAERIWHHGFEDKAQVIDLLAMLFK